MYAIYADGNVLYSPLLVNEGYCVLSPKLTVELNKSGSLSFILPPGNMMYDSIQKLKTIITVLQDGDEVFRGRVLYDEKDFYNRKKIYCEGELSFLTDSIVRPYSFQGGVAELFAQYLNNHNNQVDEEKQFQVGLVTVTDPNDYITRESSDFPKSLDEMKAKLIDLLGGYFRTRSEDGVRYLDYVKDYGNISDQIIEFGSNLLDLTEYISAEDVFTVLIPLGAEQEDSDGNSTGRLTISSVNNGNDCIEDETAVSLFGRIWKVQEWDDVAVAENLLSKGTEYLKSGIEMAVSLSIKAVDARLLNVDTGRIKLGDQVRVVSLPHKLDKYFLCSKISYDLVNPENTNYTLGVAFSALTEKQVSNEKAVRNTISVVQSTAVSTQNSVRKVNETVQQVEQVIDQIPSEYVKSSTFEAYKQEVESKISSVYRFKGSVSSYNTLPLSRNENGDVWNVLDTGANYAWTDSGWDKLSETIDLSGYVQISSFNELVERVENLENE